LDHHRGRPQYNDSFASGGVLNMIRGKDDLLMQLLNCGSLDLKLIDDVGYDFCDILEYCDGAEWVTSVGLNGVMRLVFEYGFEQIKKAISDRIEELENDKAYEDLDEAGVRVVSRLEPDYNIVVYRAALRVAAERSTG